MRPQKESPPHLRDLLVSTATPFTVKDFQQRVVIFSQGDPCDSVMYIEKGRVWLAVTAPNGREAICGLLETGALLGEEAVGGYAVRRETATAMTATTVLVVAKADMIRLIDTEPAVADLLIAHIAARHARLEADLADQLLYRSETRLAHALLALAGFNGEPRRWVLPPVSQEMIAEMIGTTRSRVNLLIGRFKNRGFIKEDRGRLQITPSLVHAVRDSIDVFRTIHNREITEYTA